MRACIFPDLTRLTLYSSDKVPSDAFVPVPHCVSVDIESRPAATGVRLSTFIFSHSAIEDVKFIRHCRRMQDFLHVGFRHAIASPAALSTEPGFSFGSRCQQRSYTSTTRCFDNILLSNCSESAIHPALLQEGRFIFAKN
jgi:hypothetical protein